ncbi:MAG: V-type ATPase subunit [Eubacterium sp.]|nr:V-type ATPase subunit [Eubacterium sp.]
MSDLDYTYAVARIRALELNLFNSSVLEQLIGASSYDDALKILADKGWGYSDIENDADAVLNCERERTWEVVSDLVEDMSVFDVMTYPDLYHNLKAAIKQVYTEEDHPRVFYKDTAVSPQKMVDIVREKSWLDLPRHMQQTASEAAEVFARTQDGQLCDIIVDRGALEAVYAAGKESKADILRKYAESTVAVADIKIAVRCQRTGKPLDFIRRALAPCDTLSIERLAQAAVSGEDAINSYLEQTDYAAGGAALAESASAFERWCDDQIIETIRPQKYNAFSIGPVVAYAIARENEIKTVRIILSGKQNALSEDSIRERVRKTYV